MAKEQDSGNVAGQVGAEFLSGTSELAGRVRAFDWTKTALGSPSTWPQSLKTAIGITLTSSQAMFVWWGKDLIHIYNDAYKAIVGGKHPEALGQPARVVWREIWDQVGPRAHSVMTKAEGTYDESLLLIMERYGYPEETYYTFSYSPIPSEDGRVGGIICANTDDTRRIVGERQLKMLRDLAAQIADARTASDVCRLAAECLGSNPRDLPFALVYLIDAEQKGAVLVGASGVAPGHALAPEELSLSARAPWPIAQVIADRERSLVSLQAFPQSTLPQGAWDRPPTQAAVVPISLHGEVAGSAILVTGLSPYRLFDEGYQGFLNLVAGQIGSGLGNAQAYENERRRAEALAELDRAKTTFFSNVSHEFRTPLTLMLSPLEGLLIRSPTAENVLAERRDLDLMHRNGLRLLKLVNTLLDFSRIEAGRVEATYEPVELGSYTAELASTFRSAMDRAGLTLTVDCPPVSQPVYVDRGMWERIVLNLVSNAFKYTLQGEVRVTLRLDSDGKTVALVVRDTGVGIPSDQLPRVFDRFHRVEGQQGRSHEGTGIGLALVLELAKLHGGSVGVESEVGQGTSFTVAIPTGTAHLQAERIVGPRAHSSNDTQSGAYIEEALRWLPGSGTDEVKLEKDLLGAAEAIPTTGPRERVLLADDNTDVRDYVSRLLAVRFDVETVGDGEAAIAAARKHRPDLILSDVMMPRLDGFGLVKAVREDPNLRFLPVILLSARAGDEAKVEGLEAGADDYLVKPFSARELIARVTTNMELSRLRRRARDVLEEETNRLRILNRTGTAITAELDNERVVQMVTDAAVELTGAQFGAFFHNVINDKGKSYMLYTLSGVSKDAFAAFPMPRNTAVFAPTFRGTGVLRLADVTKDGRYGQSSPHYGMPKGHLPVRSYLAVPVVSGTGEVHGGLFFGHPEPGMFAERDELIAVGIAAQAAVALDDAQLFQTRRRAEEQLRQLADTLEERVAKEIGERMKMEEALRQAQKMEAIGQLTGGVAHDFNNLLQVILASLEAINRRIARGNLTSADIERLTQGALTSAQRAAVLTQRLLAFSRRQPLAPRPTDVNKLVSGMSDLLRRTLGEDIVNETVL